MINDMGINVFEIVLDVDVLLLVEVDIDEVVVEEVVVVLVVVESDIGCIIDLVCMYMCEMGIVELLICEGEIEIVKCIEEGICEVMSVIVQFLGMVDSILVDYNCIVVEGGCFFDVFSGYIDFDDGSLFVEEVELVNLKDDFVDLKEKDDEEEESDDSSDSDDEGDGGLDLEEVCLCFIVVFE